MKKLMILALLVAPLALAQVEKTATWTVPFERVNGDPMTLAEIAGHDLECFRVPGGQTIYSTGLPANATTHQTAPVFDSGDFQCRMRTNDTGGLTSEWGLSNVFTVGRCEVTDCRPQPPQSIVIILGP